jgi:hypothetical protein
MANYSATTLVITVLPPVTGNSQQRQGSIDYKQVKGACALIDMTRFPGIILRECSFIQFQLRPNSGKNESMLVQALSWTQPKSLRS